MRSDSLESLKERINAFAEARDWNQFHDPKNLAMALASEVGELCAIFRWVNQADSDVFAMAHSELIRDEIGDIGILLLSFCDRLKIDIEKAIDRKLNMNALKYPIESSIGRAEPPTQ